MIMAHIFMKYTTTNRFKIVNLDFNVRVKIHDAVFLPKIYTVIVIKRGE